MKCTLVCCWVMRVHDGAVGWGTALQTGKSRVGIPRGVTGIFHRLNPSSCTITLEPT
jgi:hypothetical protein